MNGKVAWATGTQGTVLRTSNSGLAWNMRPIPGTEALDFRDVEANGTRQAWVLSSGPGEKSRVYRTADAGEHWTLNLTNPDLSGFFDAIAMFGKQRGILLGDPVNGRFVVYTTGNGKDWDRQTGPEALPGEGAFAASGTCLIARPNGEAWFGTGAARVFHSLDFGRTWTVAQTPLAHQGKSAGVFSLAFQGRTHGIAVGGDYTKPSATSGNIAVTDDGGQTWHEPRSRPAGYRSAVQFVSKTQAIATGTSGSDISSDGGNTWAPLAGTGYNALTFHGKTGWAAGPEGRIALWR